MHGYAHPAHEARLAAIAAELGFTQISTSHGVSALIKLIGRGDTTLADAYLSPVLRHYVDQFVAQLGDGINPQFMKSSGGLASAAAFHGRSDEHTPELQSLMRNSYAACCLNKNKHTKA